MDGESSTIITESLECSAANLTPYGTVFYASRMRSTDYALERTGGRDSDADVADNRVLVSRGGVRRKKGSSAERDGGEASG